MIVVDYFTSILAARVRTFVCADIAEQLAAIELAQLGETFDRFGWQIAGTHAK